MFLRVAQSGSSNKLNVHSLMRKWHGLLWAMLILRTVSQYISVCIPYRRPEKWIGNIILIKNRQSPVISIATPGLLFFSIYITDTSPYASIEVFDR